MINYKNTTYPLNETEKNELTDYNYSEDPFYDLNKHKTSETIALENKASEWISNPVFNVGYWNYLNDEEREIVENVFIEIWYRDITDRFEYLKEMQKEEVLYYKYLFEIIEKENIEKYFENEENNYIPSTQKNSETKALELKAYEWISNPIFDKGYWDYLTDEERKIVVNIFLKEWENNLNNHLKWEKKLKEEEVIYYTYLHEIIGKE